MSGDLNTEIKYHTVFLKQFDKLQREIREAFYRRLALFQQDKFHPLLNNHMLSGRYADKRSINITGDFRALYQEEDRFIIFKLIGTHHQLFGK
jgi:addiction module RelE/StbE family toxin